MSKKKWLFLLSGGALIALLLAILVGAKIVSAQESTPTPAAQTPPGGPGRGRGPGGFGGGLCGWGGGDQWTTFDATAEALGLTPEELFAELHAGKTLGEIATAQGVDIQAVQDAVNAAHDETMRQGIQQAVEDGTMSQEQADWMLEGLDKGFYPMGRGSGRGGPWMSPPEGE